jgi:hypothetical protein
MMQKTNRPPALPNNPTEEEARAFAAAQADGSQVKTYTHEKPVFVSLKVGESIRGIFLRSAQTRYGLAYRFKTEAGNIVYLSGGRFQLDALIEDLELSDDFSGGLRGHKIEIKRGENVSLDSGQTVATYSLTHIFLGCPQGCAS